MMDWLRSCPVNELRVDLGNGALSELRESQAREIERWRAGAEYDCSFFVVEETEGTAVFISGGFEGRIMRVLRVNGTAGQSHLSGCGCTCNCPHIHVDMATNFWASEYRQWVHRAQAVPADAAMARESVAAFASCHGEANASHLTNGINGASHDTTWLYTTDLPVNGVEMYRRVNDALVEDSDGLVPVLRPFLARTNAYLDVLTSESCTVYRGVDLTGLWTDYVPGAMIRFRAYTSTSSSQAVAANFGRHLIVIDIPDGFRGARRIEHVSESSEEEEILFSPWSQFEVLTVDESAGCVRLRAIDTVA